MKKYLIILAAVLCAAVSCKKAAEPDALSLNKNAFTVTAEGGKLVLEITTNTAWNISTNAASSWITLDKTSGNGNATVNMTVAANDGLDRSVEYLVSGGSLSEKFTVSQAQVESKLAFGAPVIKQEPQLNVDNSLKIEVPYTGAAGFEEVEFVLSSADEAFKETKVAYKEFKAGDGSVELTMNCTPVVLGNGTVEIVVKAAGAELGKLNARIYEPIKYDKCVCWNFWALGYSKAVDHNLLRGSKYDYSWTSEAVHATPSGVTSDHKVYPSNCTIPGNEEAYVTAVSPVEIIAGGTTVNPSGDPTGLAGYTFNPGIQIKGLLKDDYFLAVLPKVSVAANGKINIASACAGAKAAANAWIFEYSVDNKNWTAFDGAQEVEVSGEKIAYHMHYVTTYDTRYVYGKNVETDKTYTTASATVPSAINGALYVRLRACGLNGDAANKLISGTGGWSDIKFIEISF